MLQPDMEPQCRALRGPSRRRAIVRAVEGDDKAFKAAPGIAHAEQFYAVEQGIDGLLRHRFQHDAEQARGAGEIALRDRVTGIAFETGMQHAAYLRTRR